MGQMSSCRLGWRRTSWGLEALSEQRQGGGKQDLAGSMWAEKEGLREHQQVMNEAEMMVVLAVLVESYDELEDSSHQMTCPLLCRL